MCVNRVQNALIAPEDIGRCQHQSCPRKIGLVYLVKRPTETLSDRVLDQRLWSWSLASREIGQLRYQFGDGTCT